MKKIISVVLGLVLLISLNGCGAKEAVEIQKTSSGVCTPGGGCSNTITKYQGNQINNQITNFNLVKADGKADSLYDKIQGKKKIILSLVADWCSDCKRQDDKLAKYYKTLPKDYVVLVVYSEFNSASGDKDKTTNQNQMKAYAKKESKIKPYPVYYDKDNIIQNTLGTIHSTPTNYVLTDNGIINAITQEIDIDVLLMPNNENYDKDILKENS